MVMKPRMAFRIVNHYNYIIGITYSYMFNRAVTQTSRNIRTTPRLVLSKGNQDDTVE